MSDKAKNPDHKSGFFRGTEENFLQKIFRMPRPPEDSFFRLDLLAAVLLNVLHLYVGVPSDFRENSKHQPDKPGFEKNF